MQVESSSVIPSHFRKKKVSQWLFLCLLLPFLFLFSQMPSVTWLSQVTSPRMGHSLHPIFPKHIRRKWSAIISWLAVAKRGSRSPSQTLICINHPKNDQLESLYIPTHTLFFLPKTVTPVFPLFFPPFILPKMSLTLSLSFRCVFSCKISISREFSCPSCPVARKRMDCSFS